MAARHIVAIGGSDAGISAALRPRTRPHHRRHRRRRRRLPELLHLRHPVLRLREVTHWSNLAHRSAADLAVSARPPITGITGPDALGPADGVHLLHSMGDTFAVMGSLQQRNPKTAAIIGAGYIGLEMAEALALRGIAVTQIEDQHSAQLLGAQLVGHRNAEIAKRVDT